MKTINIKGNDYVTVNERLIYFRNDLRFKDWQIKESVYLLSESEGIFKVSIFNAEGSEVVSAHAQEYRDSSYINKTSFVENGFTSALGRALGYLGIGIDTSIASADEVSTAINNQKKQSINSVKDVDNRAWLTEAQLNATLKATKDQAEKVISSFRMKKDYREKINNKFNLK